MDMGKPQNDRLELAAFFLKGLLLFCIAIVLLVGFDSAHRTPVSHTRGATLFRALALSVPALIPSGREARNPYGIDKRVSSRISPFFPLPDPDPAELIIRGTVHGTRQRSGDFDGIKE
jgi:hypothetical protein